MSEAPVKPEDTVVAVPETKPEEPTTAEAPATTTEAEKPAEAEKTEGAEEKKEEAKEEKPEPKEITQGRLSKTHGGLLSIFKLKRFFYFQEEAVAEDALKTYLGKDSSSKATAAHATQTGKGLWFYSKEESHKTPHGIIKLADVSDVTTSGHNKFVLKVASGDLHFEAPPAERDNWVFTLKHKITEAKEANEGITESEGYKAALEKLTKPVVPAKPAAKAEEPKAEEEAKTEEAKPEEAKEEEKKEEEAAGEASASETKPDVKRSSSKKGRRISAFGGIFKKKDEKKEEPAEEVKEDKKEETAEGPKAEATETPAVVAEPVAATTETPAETTEAKPEETKAEEAKPEETRPEPVANKSNRRSFFSRFGKRDESVGADEKKEKEKEKEPETVPETTEAKPETEADKPEAEAKPEEKVEKAASPSSPKSDLLSFFSRRDKSPAPKLEEKKEEAKPEEAKTEEAVKPEEAAKPEEAKPEEKKDEETPAAETAAAPVTKEKRKSSFFNFGKDKKTDEVKSDSEDAEPTAKPSTSPVPRNFLTGLKRKVSKAGKSEKAESKEVAAPAAVAEEETPAAPETAEAVKTEETKPEEKKDEEPAAIGDVVPEAVTVGATKPVQAAA